MNNILIIMKMFIKIKIKFQNNQIIKNQMIICYKNL